MTDLIIGSAQWGCNKEKARLNRMFKIRKKIIKMLEKDKKKFPLMHENFYETFVKKTVELSNAI